MENKNERKKFGVRKFFVIKIGCKGGVQLNKLGAFLVHYTVHESAVGKKVLEVGY